MLPRTMNAVLCSILCMVTHARVVSNMEAHSSVDAQLVEASQPICDAPEGVDATCETCINKGPHCFWCEKTKKCSNYERYFPNCPLSSVKYNSCWVNWEALVITLSVLGGIILAILCCCCCYCCYRCKRCRMRWIQRAFEKRYGREMADRLAMENRQEQRRMERKAQLDQIRQKYGIPQLEPKFEKIENEDVDSKHLHRK